MKKILLQNRIILLLISLALTSCGLRQDETVFKNQAIGVWNLTAIECYYPDIRGSKLETYPKNENDIIEVKLTSRQFTYSVTEVGGGSCNTTASGSYTLSYTTADNGTLDYSSIINSLTCSITMAESGGAGNQTVPFGFIASSENTTSLDWKVENSKLYLQVSTGFKGSPNIAQYCLGRCECFGVYSN